MAKYYIANEIKFLAGLSAKENPSSGTHMKQSKAASFVAKNPQYSYYKTRNSSRGNDYVICTEMKFLGNDLTVVHNLGKAKSFDSVEEAYKFMDNNMKDFDKDVHIVIDGGFVRKKRPDSVPEVHDDFNKLDMLNCLEGADTSERIYIPRVFKEEVFRRSGGICEICGKPLSKYNYTIDHIIPLSRGGTNESSNLRVAHVECNKLKGNFLDKELYKNVANVAYNVISNDPSGYGAIKYFRSFVRGIIGNRGVL